MHIPGRGKWLNKPKDIVNGKNLGINKKKITLLLV